MKKVLVFGTGYFNNEWKLRLLKQWYRLLFKPTEEEFDVTYAIIDSNSPLPFVANIFPGWGYRTIGEDLESVDLTGYKYVVVSFLNNAGHLCNRPPFRAPEDITGDFGDGAGRSICQGFKMAIENGFDYAVHLECDMLYFGNYLNIVQMMIENKYRYVSAICPNFRAHENNIMFGECNYLKDVNFIEKYNWHYREFWPLSEQRIQSIVEQDVYWHPFNGRRVEGSISNDEIKRDIEAGTLDYITHFDDELLTWIEKWDV